MTVQLSLVAVEALALLSCSAATKPPAADVKGSPFELNHQLLMPASGREIFFLVESDSEHGFQEGAVRSFDSDRGALGWATREVRRNHCGARALYMITVNQAKVAPLRILWLTAEKLEERALVHECGHLLGLGRNPSHNDLAVGFHCKNADCVFARPTEEAVLHTIYKTGLTFRNVDDYCDECRADIEVAKEFWRSRSGP